MLNFQELTEESILRVKDLFSSRPFRTCDYTVGAMWQWREWFRIRAAFAGPCAIIRSEDPPLGGFWYSFPWGGDEADRRNALKAIEADARERNQPLRFSSVPKEALLVLRDVYGERIRSVETDRDEADYLYAYDDLRLFPGKRFHGQKNHLNRFLKDNPFSYFVPVNGETLSEARAFLAEYARNAEQETAIVSEELARSMELLECSERLGMKAGFLRADREHICALSIGEIVGDTLYVHVEKADTARYPGAYQAIVSAFAQYAATPGVRWINREDDSGDEGLRQSKQSYHPVELLEKNRIVVDIG